VRLERKTNALSETQEALFAAVDACMRSTFTGTVKIEVVMGKSQVAISTAESYAPGKFAVRTI
jgi:hypothetical protein